MKRAYSTYHEKGISQCLEKRLDFKKYKDLKIKQ